MHIQYSFELAEFTSLPLPYSRVDFVHIGEDGFEPGVYTLVALHASQVRSECCHVANMGEERSRHGLVECVLLVIVKIAA